MASQTTLEPFNIGPATVTKKFWLVDSKDSSEALEAQGAGGFFVSIDKGAQSINRWTAGKKFGDWEEYSYAIKHSTVVVAFSPMVFADKKAKNFIDELKPVLAAAGTGVKVIAVPNGSDLSSLLKKTSVEDLIDGDAHSEEQDTRPTDADIMFQQAEEDFTFCRTSAGEYFLLPKNNLPVYAWMVNDERLRLRLINVFRKSTGKVPAPSAWVAALDAIKAACAVSETVKELKVRSAKSGEDYWIDLGTDDGRAVAFNASGYQIWSSVPSDLPFAFRRTSAVLPLPVPAPVAEADTKITLQKLLKTFVNVSDDEWPLLVSYMVTHLMDGYKMPIMLLTSEAQSGKSTATMAIRFAVEGNLGRGEKMPSKEDDIAVTMSQESMTLYNNVSHISAELSDFLCQVVDGARYAKRKLRTDNDVVQLTLDSSLLMNGITTGELRSDFKTRTVRLGLVPMTNAAMRDEQIDEALIQSHPQILGCLLTLAVGALQRMPLQDQFPRGFRMLDYVKVATAVDSMWGMEGRSIAKYKASLDEMSAEGLDDPLFETIRKLVVTHANQVGYDHSHFEATLGVKEILATYKSNAFSDAMDSLLGGKKKSITTGQKLNAELIRAKTDWKRHGITFENLGQKRINGVKDTYITFTFVATEATTWDNEPTHLVSI